MEATEEQVERVARVLAKQYSSCRWSTWSEYSREFFLRSARAVLEEAL